MQSRSLLAPLALAGLLMAGCGGSDPIPADAAAAYEAGTSALVKKDYERATQAFQQVADDQSAGDIIRYKAWLALGEVQALTADVTAAKASFGKARDLYGAHHDIRGAKKIIDAYLGAGDVLNAESELMLAFEKFPEARAALETQKKGLEALRSGDSIKLEELGYVGD